MPPLDGEVVVQVPERQRDSAKYLAEAGALLQQFGDTTLQAIADLAIPTLADWCFIHLLAPGGVTTAALAHVDPARRASARSIADTVRRIPTDTAVARVLAGGPAELIEVDDAMLKGAAVDDKHLERLRSEGYRSSVVAPLVGRNGVQGAITFVMSDSGRRYASADLETLCELARRTGIALENARLFAAAQRHAKRLKRPTNAPAGCRSSQRRSHRHSRSIRSHRSSSTRGAPRSAPSPAMRGSCETRRRSSSRPRRTVRPACAWTTFARCRRANRFRSAMRCAAGSR